MKSLWVQVRALADAVWSGAWMVIARSAALAALVVYAPSLAVIAVGVLISSEGPVFVSRRYWRPDGTNVELWEFRTEHPYQSAPTAIGRALKALNMHRTPSLVNVLLGQVAPGESLRAQR